VESIGALHVEKMEKGVLGKMERGEIEKMILEEKKGEEEKKAMKVALRRREAEVSDRVRQEKLGQRIQDAHEQLAEDHIQLQARVLALQKELAGKEQEEQLAMQKLQQTRHLQRLVVAARDSGQFVGADEMKTLHPWSSVKSKASAVSQYYSAQEEHEGDNSAGFFDSQAQQVGGPAEAEQGAEGGHDVEMMCSVREHDDAAVANIVLSAHSGTTSSSKRRAVPFSKLQKPIPSASPQRHPSGAAPDKSKSRSATKPSDPQLFRRRAARPAPISVSAGPRRTGEAVLPEVRDAGPTVESHCSGSPEALITPVNSAGNTTARKRSNLMTSRTVLEKRVNNFVRSVSEGTGELVMSPNTNGAGGHDLHAENKVLDEKENETSLLRSPEEPGSARRNEEPPSNDDLELSDVLSESDSGVIDAVRGGETVITKPPAMNGVRPGAPGSGSSFERFASAASENFWSVGSEEVIYTGGGFPADRPVSVMSPFERRQGGPSCSRGTKAGRHQPSGSGSKKTNFFNITPLSIPGMRTGVAKNATSKKRSDGAGGHQLGGRSSAEIAGCLGTGAPGTISQNQQLPVTTGATTSTSASSRAGAASSSTAAAEPESESAMNKKASPTLVSSTFQKNSFTSPRGGGGTNATARARQRTLLELQSPRVNKSNRRVTLWSPEKTAGLEQQRNLILAKTTGGIPGNNEQTVVPIAGVASAALQAGSGASPSKHVMHPNPLAKQLKRVSGELEVSKIQIRSSVLAGKK